MIDWFKNIYKKIQESNDNTYLDKITKQKEDIRKLGIEINNIVKDKNELQKTFNIAIEEINRLSEELSKFKPLPAEIQDMTDYFKIKPTKYKYKPKKYDYLHKTLENFSKDIEYQEKYLAFLIELGIKDNYSSVDKMVYDITYRVQKYINRTLKDDYKTDKEVFGVNEYWLTPKEAFDQYVINKLASDCEDVSALLYGSIITGLNYFGYSNDTWRLLRVDINFPVGHAVIVFLKSNHVWACIESTYGESRFYKNWTNNKDMFKGVYTGIWHVFNEKTEYELR